MKQIAAWSMVVFWFLHLLLAAGSGYAVLRLWPSRANPFIWRVAIYMNATAIGGVMAIVLVFLAKGVTLTWKFAIAWFVGNLLMDMARVPLILYLCLGQEAATQTEPEGGPPEG